MTLAKPLAGGLPIGALLATERVAAALTYGDHGSTFAGSPLITAVANYVFDRISAPEFLEHVQRVGSYLKARLEAISSPMVKEVRGRGLMLGIEFTGDLAASVVEQGYAHGLLLVGAGANVFARDPALDRERVGVRLVHRASDRNFGKILSIEGIDNMARQHPQYKKVVLAYSGGLDTSVIVPWLRETYHVEVICFTADLGQGEELDGLEEKALKSGASKLIIRDLRREFLTDFILRRCAPAPSTSANICSAPRSRAR